MKLFTSEFIKDYSSYSFGYTNYCWLEERSELPTIYDKGFLPYSGNPSLDGQLFYMARSLRFNLEEFVDSSENKRVVKKMDELNPQLAVFEKKNFDMSNPEFFKFCMNYASARFSNSSISESRLTYIFNRSIGSHIFKFSNEEKDLGFVYAVIEADCLHYWFSFFDLDYLRSHSLGKYMMWRVARWAKDQGLQYCFVGTCYGSHSLYKVRDFKGVEYWNGAFWSNDKNQLKSLCKTDAEPKSMDLFKGLDDPNDFLRQLNST